MHYVIQISETDYNKCLDYLKIGIHEIEKAPVMCKLVEAILSSEDKNE